MDYNEEEQWITMLVHKASSKDEAIQEFQKLDGIFMPKHLAQSIFNDAVHEKFDVVHDVVQAQIREVQSKLK